MQDVFLSLLTDTGKTLQTGRLLDVGCRDLSGSDRIQKWLGDRYYGVDVDASAVARAVEKLGGDGNLAFVEPDDFGTIFRKTFDVVMASCVLYHLTDPLAATFFQRLDTYLLAPGGVCFANVNTSHPPLTWEGFPFVRRTLRFYDHLASRHNLHIKRLGTARQYDYQLDHPAGDNQLLEIRRRGDDT
jgi:predicted TPR repeat methyltransferase